MWLYGKLYVDGSGLNDFSKNWFLVPIEPQLNQHELNCKLFLTHTCTAGSKCTNNQSIDKELYTQSLCYAIIRIFKGFVRIYYPKICIQMNFIQG